MQKSLKVSNIAAQTMFVVLDLYIGGFNSKRNRDFKEGKFFNNTHAGEWM